MASTYTPIATTTLGVATASVSFTSISATYTDIQIVISGAVTTGSINIALQFNADTAANYSHTYISGNGTTVATARVASDTSTKLGTITPTQSNAIFQIQNYSNTTTFKSAIGRSNTADYQTNIYTGLWRSTAAINRIDILNTGATTYIAGTTFTLYGIKAA